MKQELISLIEGGNSLNPNWKVLVTARAYWVSGQQATEKLTDAGCEVVHSPQSGPIQLSTLVDLLQGFDAIIAASDPYNEYLFTSCPTLKMVSRCGIGIDRIDLEAATKAGVLITNTPGAMTEAVADYTFALLLGIARKIVEGDVLMRAGGWAELPGVELPGKTLGLVGFGRIGKAVARRAVGFGMHIIACDPPLALHSASSNEHGAHLELVPFVSLNELLEQSDFVSLHAPANRDTFHMFNADRFALMKPTAYFVNTARGALVDDIALRDALVNRIIRGAGIDVYHEEPLPPDSFLRQMPNCVLAPHNAFNSMEASTAMSICAAENILTVLRGEPPVDTCNPNVLDSSQLRLKP